MVIHPEIIVTPDQPTIKFREPREKVDLDLEIPKVLHAQGWGIGTYFNVQFINHDRTELLAAALFLVNAEAESIHTSDNIYSPMTRAVHARGFVQVGGWWEIGPEVLQNTDVTCWEGQTETAVLPVDEDPIVKWNYKLKLHQVKRGDEVLFESKDKAEALAYGERLLA